MVIAFAAFCGVETNGAPIAVGETSDTRASATDVDPFFSVPPPATVFGMQPTATVTSTIDDATDVDWYSFSANVPAVVYFDIDNDPFTFDSNIWLFDAAGTVIGRADDSFPADPGSTTQNDAFFGVFSLPAQGTYFVAVSGFGRSPVGLAGTALNALIRPDGAPGGFALSGAPIGNDDFEGASIQTGAYTLHITIPEPSTFLLGALGFSAVLVCYRWRRRSA